MSSSWIRSVDGMSLLRADEIVSLYVEGGLLVAQVGAERVVELAEGEAEALSQAAEVLTELIQSRGADDVVISAVRRSAGIEWEVSQGDGSGGSDSASISIKPIDKIA